MTIPPDIAEWLRGLPPGTHVQVEWDEEDGGLTTRDASGSATGAGATAIGADLKDSVTGTPATVDIGSASGSGGSLDRQSSGTAFGGGDALGSILLWAGIAALAGGAGLWWAGFRKLAIHAGVLGAALIAVAMYPALAVFVLLGAAAVALFPTLLAEWRARKVDHTLARVVQGVEEASKQSPQSADIVKANLSRKMDATDKALIRTIKARATT
jgi:hypothetical protein